MVADRSVSVHTPAGALATMNVPITRSTTRPTTRPIGQPITRAVALPARAGLSLALSCVALVGCVTPEPPLYRWGEYENIVYQSYRETGESDPVNDAVKLEEDIARTEAEGLAVPPGARVHLGYLYFNQGRVDDARALFEQERDVFPESTVFVDGLLQRMGTR